MGSLKIKIKNNKKKSVWRSQKENSAAVVGIKRNRKIKFNFKILDKKRKNANYRINQFFFKKNRK